MGNLNGINPEIREQLWFCCLQRANPNLIIRHAEKISMSKSGWTIFPSLNVRAIWKAGASF
jgi:hypothetical protein